MTSERFFTLIESIMSTVSSIAATTATSSATVSTPPTATSSPSSTARVPLHITTSIILTSLTSSVVGGSTSPGGANGGSDSGNGVHNGQNKRPTIILYPTVSPESVVIPIVSCIFGFPLLALLVICCLRRRAKLARERDRRRNYDLQDHAMSLVRFSPIHRLTNRSTRAISLRSERSMSRGFPSLELDTVLEEKSDTEQTNNDLVTTDSPTEILIIHNMLSQSNNTISTSVNATNMITTSIATTTAISTSIFATNLVTKTNIIGNS